METGEANYVRRLLDALQRRPGRQVLHRPEGSTSGGALAAAILATAVGLARAGVARGETVAVLTEPNVPAMLVTRYAAHLLGATVTHVRSMNARADGEHLSTVARLRVLRATGARTLVVDAANAGRGRELAVAAPALTVLAVDDLLRHRSGRLPTAAWHPNDIAVVDLTSGSSGDPKLVRQPFGARDTRIRVSAGDGAPDWPVTMLSVTPVSHATATMVDAVLIGGGAVVLRDGFGLDDVVDAVVRHRVTDVYLAVPHLYQLVDRPEAARRALPSLRQVLYSGTFAAPTRIAQAVTLFGERLTQLYGSTEAGGMCTLTPLDHAEPELLPSVGRPFSWVDLEIREADGRAATPRGVTGEVWVRAATTMAGYLGDPALTAQTMHDGWLRTGDLARFDRYGYLHLVGRIGSVIKANGLKIHPSTVERVLLAHPAVADAVVYDRRDPRHGETAHAAVQLRPGVRCGAAQLRDHVAAGLSPAHVPASFSFLDALPLTVSGKPDRVALRAAAD
ncbi:class I adenylate-forming enzyme family protein [Micromonospora sp. NPDC049175]|uniref:class I adenylate-forming enzyme family protein n=1 Tax=Micromonospora sp. NPDC049175 TaxID=3364266 RepID=UPI003717463C